MDDELQASLLSALGIAAFERMGDGAFRSVAPVPAWLQRVMIDGTFPFLGHVLTEATDFWNAGTDTAAEWGPCAETDESGREFHYRVVAVSLAGKQYLMLRLDPESDHMREVLQSVRSQALAGAVDAGGRSALVEVQREVRKARVNIHERVLQLLGRATSTQLEALRDISASCDKLADRVDALLRTTRPSAGPR